MKKEFSYGHILTTLSIIIAGMGWAFSIDKNVAVLEAKLHASSEQAVEMQGKFGEELRRINDKLDRVIERLIVGKK